MLEAKKILATQMHLESVKAYINKQEVQNQSPNQ